MLAFWAALVAPVLGALLYGVLHERPRTMRFVDTSMRFAIPVLVGWQVLHHGWEEFGLLAVAAIGLGVATPPLIERLSRAIAPYADNISIVAGISGLALHALLEGAALAPEGAGLQIAVILHRVPIGLVIWWMVRPRHGRRGAALGIGALAAATALGYFLGEQVLSEFEAGATLYQAYVGGSLMHVVFHQSRRDHRHDAHGGGHRH